MPYYVKPDDVTPDEPSPGWYYWKDSDEEGRIVGPFSSRFEALDDMSDGAYSEYAQGVRDENDARYRQDMRDAGRGHLLRD